MSRIPAGGKATAVSEHEKLASIAPHIRIAPSPGHTIIDEGLLVK